VPVAGEPPRQAAPSPTTPAPGDRYVEHERVPACAVCGDTRRTTIDRDASVVRCGGCGHRYVDPRPTQAEILRGYARADAYDAWLESDADRERLWRRRCAAVLAGGAPGRLLDVSAGVGTFLAVAREHGWIVEGTEVSPTAVAHARDRHGLALHLGTLDDVTLAGPFDAITLWHVLEHVPDPLDLLRRCRGLLAPGGRLILAMPNDGAAARRLTEATNIVRRVAGRPVSGRYLPLAPGVESHIQHFEPATVRRAIQATGFDVVSISADDAAPRRSRPGRAVFAVRAGMTRLLPWNFAHEMLVVARPRS
jgi:2-polyprenyl-3-methyl-5-hydroxy-6-metoxy-1,4-benzoquinol methylase